MPNKRIINAAVKLISAQYPDWRGARVLDLSCGDGELLATLAAAGCRVEGTHFRSDDYIYKKPAAALQNAHIHTGIDLARPLPFPDAEYDIVCATEVLEHLPSHLSLLSETARILKNGGLFVFSTPNIHRLSSRLQFMLTGQHDLRSARLGWDVKRGDLYSTHYNPVYFPVIHTLLYHNNLRVRQMAFTKCKPLTLLPGVLYPLVAVMTVVQARHALKRSRAGGRDLLRWMLDYRMLFSDKLMLAARKTAPSPGVG